MKEFNEIYNDYRVADVGNIKPAVCNCNIMKELSHRTQKDKLSMESYFHDYVHQRIDVFYEKV